MTLDLQHQLLASGIGGIAPGGRRIGSSHAGDPGVLLDYWLQFIQENSGDYLDLHFVFL